MTCLHVDMNFSFDCSRWWWTALRNTFHGIYELSEPLHHAVWFLSHTVENISSWSQYFTRSLHLFVKYWLEHEKMRICICCRSFYSLGQFVSRSGQFVSAKVNFFQTRSTCFTLFNRTCNISRRGRVILLLCRHRWNTRTVISWTNLLFVESIYM